jgi:hypothetical protein
MVQEEKREKNEAAQRLGALRKIVDGTCEVCGKPFRGIKKRRYCSHNCAQKAHYQAKKRKAMEAQ